MNHPENIRFIGQLLRRKRMEKELTISQVQDLLRWEGVVDLEKVEEGEVILSGSQFHRLLGLYCLNEEELFAVIQFFLQRKKKP